MKVLENKQRFPSSIDHHDVTISSVLDERDGNKVTHSSPSAGRRRSRSPFGRGRSRSPFRRFSREREPSFLDPDVFDDDSDDVPDRAHAMNSSDIPAEGVAAIDDSTIATSQLSTSTSKPAKIRPFSYERTLPEAVTRQPIDMDIEQGYSTKASSSGPRVSTTGGHIFMNNSIAPAESESTAHVTNARGSALSYVGVSYDQDGSVDNSSMKTTVPVIVCRVTIVIVICAIVGIFLPAILQAGK